MPVACRRCQTAREQAAESYRTLSKPLMVDPLTIPSEIDDRTVDYIRNVAATVDAKGGYFPGHSDAVAYLAGLIGVDLGIDVEQIGRLQIAALLHDAGKIRVPDAILRAPRPLTEDEWAVMRM